jgi:hypothetical protein
VINESFEVGFGLHISLNHPHEAIETPEAVDFVRVPELCCFERFTEEV